MVSKGKKIIFCSILLCSLTSCFKSDAEKIEAMRSTYEGDSAWAQHYKSLEEKSESDVNGDVNMESEIIKISPEPKSQSSISNIGSSVTSNLTSYGDILESSKKTQMPEVPITNVVSEDIGVTATNTRPMIPAGSHKGSYVDVEYVSSESVYSSDNGNKFYRVSESEIIDATSNVDNISVTRVFPETTQGNKLVSGIDKVNSINSINSINSRVSRVSGVEQGKEYFSAAGSICKPMKMYKGNGFTSDITCRYQGGEEVKFSNYVGR